MAALNHAHTHYSETEAAKELGLTVDEFRDLIRDHIVDKEDELRNTRRAIFHPSDLLVLRLLSGRPTASTTPG